MSNIRRYYKEGQVYFITCVTHKRKRILTPNIDLFWDGVESTKNRLAFKILAWVINPDHFHMIIDPKNSDLSDIVKRMKLSFSKKIRFRYKGVTGRIWQNRFWDHVIRDQKDLDKHLDYIHYNPVKHNLAESPYEYEYSSIHKYSDFYGDDWGAKEPININGQFGE